MQGDDEAPRETTEERCPYCGSKDVVPTGGSTQVGLGNPWKEGRDCGACGRHFRKIRPAK